MPIPELPLIAQGKVRDIYSTSDPNVLLFVATDRISAFDVILNNPIPDKGKLLTQLSLFWFEKLKKIIPNHLITADIDLMPSEVQPHRAQLEGRAMLVKKAKVVPVEAIVRGYLSGSAWVEYKNHGTVHGASFPPGLLESSKFHEPIFTPSTKAEQGAHDENLTIEQATALLGPELYEKISDAALTIYRAASEHALSRGLILADTKFEFGLVPSSSSGRGSGELGGEDLILIDELLTPDSSRYWPLDGYKPGGGQPSFDKQFVRDWLLGSGFKKGLEGGPEGKSGEGWTLPEDVVDGTKRRYVEVVDMLVKS